MASLEDVFNHVVLPPRVPGQQDHDIGAIGESLRERLNVACHTLRGIAGGAFDDGWRDLTKLLENCQLVNNENLDKASLCVAFEGLEHDKQVLVCYVVEQNAAILIHRQTDPGNKVKVIFEAFEASPQSQDVLEAPNALLWEFPSRAVHVSKATFDDDDFRSTLALFLDKASTERLSQFAAKATKAQSSVSEIRDTSHPALITHMLLSVLEALGGPEDVPVLRKRVRDDVNLNSGDIPWRRLPLWLVLRVAVQRQLSLTYGHFAGHAMYKLLVCVFLAQFLDRCVQEQIHPSQVVLAQKKLGRRLAKLEKLLAVDFVDKGEDVDSAHQLFRSASNMFLRSIEAATQYINSEFDRFRNSTIRKIPKLPRSVPRNDIYLSLPSSKEHLDRLLVHSSQAWRSANHSIYNATSNLGDGTGVRTTLEFSKKILNIPHSMEEAELGTLALSQLNLADLSMDKSIDLCRNIATVITNMMALVPSPSDGDTELASALLLNIFEQWVQMDTIAVAAHPMLGDYNPIFQPQLLDVLQLPKLRDMERLRRIQAYLRRRQIPVGHLQTTIFSELDKHCLGKRFAEASEELRSLKDRIRQEQERKRNDKTREWEQACQQYENLTSQISAATCKCTFYRGRRNFQDCRHCYKWRVRNRMTITTCEDLLPDDDVLASAIVFELQVPKCIAIYRSTTWKMASALAYPQLPKSRDQGTRLRKHSGLSRYTAFVPDYSSVSLASYVKSFEETHYKELSMQVDLAEVLLPFGSKMRLLDEDSGQWIRDFDEPLTLAHRCGVHVPGFLRATVLPVAMHPSLEPQGPSSYETVASRPECPLGLSIHEFEAFQRLLAGKSRRWLTMLVELGCSNLNFSKQDTMLVLSHLAHQAGPQHADKPGWEDVRVYEEDSRGICHSVFTDAAFLERLLEELSKRLESIQSNWRETNTMELLITLALRARNLATENAEQQNALARLLKQARSTALDWVHTLQKEVASSRESDFVQRASAYAFKAAMLCRRTFAVYAEGSTDLDTDDLSCYIRASIALQQNLVVSIDTLDRLERNMLHRDIIMADGLRDKIRLAIETYPGSMNAAISQEIGLGNIADAPEGTSEEALRGNVSGVSSTDFTPWVFLENDNEGWIVATTLPHVHDSYSVSQQVCFHYADGHVLVDGKTVGKLPDDIRDSDEVKELFEGQHLLTLPSNLPGMSYRLLSYVSRLSVHFGRRDGRVIVATRDYVGCVREYVPRSIFIDRVGNYDLPRGLVDGCVHWLNTSSGMLEIRRKKFRWTTRTVGDWFLNVRSRQAQRNRVLLVDPYSPTCGKLKQIFNQFEDSQRLVVFQPLKGSLSVEIRHLELSFYVNQRYNLQCRELNAEVDPNQDAGTLHGYKSKIVLRDIFDFSHRSIIVRLGPVRHTAEDVHVAAWTDLDLGPRGRGYGRQGGSNGDTEKAYARFGIDTTLGRLTCPQEPRLLYTKAQLHAVTSLPVPDPLTGRTGEEEAIHTLLSGRCQPWTVLCGSNIEILKQIGRLSPQRTYYPKELRVLQSVTWDASLPLGLQNDRYGRIARELLAKSEALACFEAEAGTGRATKPEKAKNEDDTPIHLHVRGEIQRLRYECPREAFEALSPGTNQDLKYSSLGLVEPLVSQPYESHSHKSSFVVEVTKMQLDRREALPMVEDLHDILNGWPVIVGFRSACNVDSMPISLFLSDKELGEKWGGLVELCRRAQQTASPAYRVMFTLAQLAFASHPNTDALRLLAGYSYLPDLASLVPPTHQSFAHFKFDEEFTVEALKNHVASAYVSYDSLSEHNNITGWDAIQAAQRDHNKRCAAEGLRFARFIHNQWPQNTQPSADGFASDVINIRLALDHIVPEWNRLQQNRDLSTYVTDVEQAIANYRTKPPKVPCSPTTAGKKSCPGPFIVAKRLAVPSLTGRLVNRPMTLPPNFGIRTPENVHATPQLLPSGNFTAAYTQPSEFSELRGIVSSFSGSTDPLRRNYGQDLAESLAALERLDEQLSHERSTTKTPYPKLEEINSQIVHIERELSSLLNYIAASFSRVSHGDRNWAQTVGLWPRLTSVSILELLRSASNLAYGKNVKEALVDYGRKMARLQRLQRIRRAILKNDERRLDEEWRNKGHDNWDPAEQPDWLLLEIDTDLLIRAEQVDVARAIISPESGSNAVMQLNMGKGKTSCIVPMAIAILADAKQLARLLVPKALLLPTAQMVQSRLGGLVGRELRHIPFARRLVAGSGGQHVVQIFKQHHDELLRNRGVLLAAPEHVMAFELSGLQCLADGSKDLAKEMMGFHKHLTTNMCRDVLDESDFTLAVRTQLVYPSGEQTMVDGAPYRWKLAQSLLALVEDNLHSLRLNFPHSVDVLERPGGGYPMIYILNSDVEQELHRRIAEDISRGRVPFFRPAPEMTRRTNTTVVSPDEVRLRLAAALSTDASEADINGVTELFSDSQSVANGLLYVRGILSNGILLTCLKKRWNVKYGLHPLRWPIAVPFEAKGVPSERSEFGHPDVSIFFTCLAFYYTGLNGTQFREGLQHVLHHADDPASEYEQWISGGRDVHLPAELRNWNAINVDDEGQVKALWTHLRFTRPVIDHYLNTFVFPVHCKQFAVKLQASAWDLPLFTPGAENVFGRAARTTGFSGTNDNKMMLPLTIKQEDLPSLRQTNAEVLTYLLKERSRDYVCTGTRGRRWSETKLLDSLYTNHIRVLIDAGAYVLENDNESLVRAWLKIDTKCPAAVYFGEKDNRAWVVFRNAATPKAPLVATPFVDRLDECIVYFDEAHTRGVDLQLPPLARGALTLALGQTKDHTVQAAMRLRQLATTQSVMFYAPPEVDRSIRDVCGQQLAGCNTKIQSPHVIAWLLEQTCLANEQLRPLYTSHGRDFCRRTNALSKYNPHTADSDARLSLLKVLEQPERQTLSQLYGQDQSEGRAQDDDLALPELRAFSSTLRAQRQAGHAGQGAFRQAVEAFEEVEQEREVEAQIEEVRSKERKKKFKALKFPGAVHQAIRNFVQDGRLRGGEGYEQAFSNIANTHIGMRYGVRETGSQLFMSEEFAKTIELPADGRHPYDDFIRPVEWLLWSPSTETGLVIIPEELELLLPLIRRSQSIYLLAYAAPVTRAMVDFSRLQFYAVSELPKDYTLPNWLAIEVGILAGRLYMSFEETTHMTNYLSRIVDISADSQALEGDDGAFCRDPVGFLLEWLPLRRAAQDIMYTPAAYICQGRPLRRDHPFFADSNRLSSADGSPGPSSSTDRSSRNSSRSSDAFEQDHASDGENGSRVTSPEEESKEVDGSAEGNDEGDNGDFWGYEEEIGEEGFYEEGGEGQVDEQ